MLCIVATLKSKPGQAGALHPILQKLARMSRAEPGVLRYEVYRLSGTEEFILFEHYVDESGFERHKTSRHVVVAFARAATLMEGELCVRNAEILSVEQNSP